MIAVMLFGPLLGIIAGFLVGGIAVQVINFYKARIMRSTANTPHPATES